MRTDQLGESRMNDKDQAAIDGFGSYGPGNTKVRRFKQWPTPLVERIAEIDLKAAEWIVDHWGDLLEDKYTSDSLCGPDRYSRDACALN